MPIRCIWEHNGSDSLLYAESEIGAFARGASLDEAMRKMPEEIRKYRFWLGAEPLSECSIEVIQEKETDLCISDADSDVLFVSEETPLSLEAYHHLKSLAMKSAEDFYALYISIPDKHKSTNPVRKTFYGKAPRTAEEMYQHTKNVNAYYFSEIGVDADHAGTIVQCREKGFETLEAMPGFLSMPVSVGSYNEKWSLRKVCRRFIWHDRIHAKAMYRMALSTFGANAVPDVFGFDR